LWKRKIYFTLKQSENQRIYGLAAAHIMYIKPKILIPRTINAQLKQGLLRPGDEPCQAKEIEIIDVSGYQPKRIPSKTWRECINQQ